MTNHISPYRKYVLLPLFVVTAIVLLTACGGVSQQDAEATGVALGRTAAAADAVTAEAIRISAEATVRAEIEATNNVAPATVAVETPESAEVEATPVPLQTPDEPDAVPTPPVFIIQGAPGDRNGLTGDVFTFAGLQIDPDQQTFQDSIVFLVNGVYASDGEAVEGQGVEELRFTITEASGQVVHTQTVDKPLYCAFGGSESNCDIWVFAEHNNRWPSGAQVRSGLHNAVIEGSGIDPNNTALWLYDFNIALPGFDVPQPNTARITSITLDGSRYVVAFETVDFTPTWGAQHVHFFFDTVPPAAAGVPGSGPWQLYPASADGPNSSPFTMYTTDNRPAAAQKLCILVANANHSVNQGTGNCVWLP